MSVGADIEAVLNELGTTVIIDRLHQEFLSYSSDEYDEYTEYEEKIELSAPERTTNLFFREFLMDGSFHYQTQIESGDILTVKVSNIRYLTLTKSPEIFEDEVIEYRATLFKCNSHGIILQQVGGDIRDSSYQVMTAWVPVYQKLIPALLYDHQAFDRTGTISTNWVDVTTSVQQGYFSGFHPVFPLQRFRVFSETFPEWLEWDDNINYSRGQKVFTDDYKLYKSVRNNNVGNDPRYTNQPYDLDDQDYVQYWQEIAYRDYKLEKAELNKFDNIIQFMIIEDLR